MVRETYNQYVDDDEDSNKSADMYEDNWGDDDIYLMIGKAQEKGECKNSL